MAFKCFTDLGRVDKRSGDIASVLQCTIVALTENHQSNDILNNMIKTIALTPFCRTRSVGDFFESLIYFSRYERKEDEERDQQQVNEYFQNVLLPSPWLDTRAAEMLKRVTFSPHPPSTRYISAQHDDSSMTGKYRIFFSLLKRWRLVTIVYFLASKCRLCSLRRLLDCRW